MKKSRIVQVVALAIMGLSGHAMAASVGPASSMKTTVEFADVVITSHTLIAQPVMKPGSKITGNPTLATGDVKSSSKAHIAIQPVRMGDDPPDANKGSKFFVTGKNGNKILMYLSSVSGKSRLTMSTLMDWYDIGNATDATYAVRLWDDYNVPADVYPVTVNAAIYTP